jgi:hypothetical protein
MARRRRYRRNGRRRRSSGLGSMKIAGMGIGTLAIVGVVGYYLLKDKF